MADSLAMRAALDQASVLDLAAGIQAPRALPALLLRVPDLVEGQPAWGQVHLLRVRENGFMIIAPDEAAIVATLESLNTAEDGSEVVVLYHGAVEMVSTRGRALGSLNVVLADLSWAAVGLFIRQSALRGSLLKASTVVGIDLLGEKGRPDTAASLALASTWVAEAMDEDTAQEYATAAEEEIIPEEEAVEPLDGEPLSTRELELQAAEIKIRQLEAELKAAKEQHQPPPSRVQFGKTPGLFQPERASTVKETDFHRLQRLAGTPPPRTGLHERRRTTPSAAMSQAAELDGLLAEGEKEAVDLGTLDGLLDATDPSTPSVTQMLLQQMQPNGLLLQKLVGKQQIDPVMASLSGQDSGSTSSSSGVKGCLAREAFVRAVADLTSVGQTVRRNALAELGMDQSREDASVMRRYIERRVPLADHKLLCHVATLAAEGWAIAFESKNHEMLGWIGILLMFIEQVALDQGRLQLGWLLTGLAEPNHHVHFSHRKKPGLKPFSRLANPIWVSANLAFLRDLDFIQARMEQVGKKAPQITNAENEDEDAEPKPAPKRRNRKSQGKGSSGDTAT